MYTRREFLKLIGSLAISAAIPVVVSKESPGSFDLGEITDWKDIQFTHIPRFEDGNPTLHLLSDKEGIVEIPLSWDTENCDPLADLQALDDYMFGTGWTPPERYLYVSKNTDVFFRKHYGEDYGRGVIKVWPEIKGGQ